MDDRGSSFVAVRRIPQGETCHPNSGNFPISFLLFFVAFFRAFRDSSLSLSFAKFVFFFFPFFYAIVVVLVPPLLTFLSFSLFTFIKKMKNILLLFLNWISYAWSHGPKSRSNRFVIGRFINPSCVMFAAILNCIGWWNHFLQLLLLSNHFLYNFHICKFNLSFSLLIVIMGDVTLFCFCGI